MQGDDRVKLLFFSKNVDTLPIAEAGLAMKEMGFDGVDLPVRPAAGGLPPGRVLPDNVRSGLAPVIKALKEFGLDVPMLSTNITSADDRFAVDTFEAAGVNGVAVIKLGLWNYGGFGTFGGEMDAVSRRLDSIENLAERTGVRAVIHVHSGNIMSASPLAVWYWIKDRNPAAVGAYVDFEHITLETGPASRTMALDLLGQRTHVIGVKDFAWKAEEGSPLITKLAKVRVPVGKGVVPWAEMFTRLNQAGADPFISVHSEYLNANSWRVLSVRELIEQTTEDVKYLRSLMKDHHQKNRKEEAAEI